MQVYWYFMQYSWFYQRFQRFLTWEVKELLEQLPVPFHVNGDTVYVNAEYLMAPHLGAKLSATIINFFHSQLRIFIECTFGLFVRTFGILWKPLAFKLRKIFVILNACARLHNFIRSYNIAVNSSKYTSPDSADIGEEGILKDARWKIVGDAELGTGTGRNTLRELLTLKIKGNPYMYKIRAHHK